MKPSIHLLFNGNCAAAIRFRERTLTSRLSTRSECLG